MSQLAEEMEKLLRLSEAGAPDARVGKLVDQLFAEAEEARYAFQRYMRDPVKNSAERGAISIAAKRTVAAAESLLAELK